EYPKRFVGGFIPLQRCTSTASSSGATNASIHSRPARVIAGPFKPAKKELNFKKNETYREDGHVEFKVACLYDGASLVVLRSLSSRFCKCCQVLCAVKRGNSRRTP